MAFSDNQETDLETDSSLPAELEQELADVLDEYLQAVQEGKSVDVGQLAARYPEYQDTVREYLEGLNLLQGFGPLGDGDLTRSDTGNRTTLSGDTLQLEQKRLGKYRIGQEIGRGGMGVVYQATQEALARPVALKVLPFAAILDHRQIVRFENEARAAAQLQHPHIVPVYDVGTENGIHFYAMQLIEGDSFRGVIDDAIAARRGDAVCSDADRAPLTDVKQVAQWAAQVADALHAAHECGVIHRDIKPSNLMLDKNGDVWVTDFGLAHSHANPSMTQSGDVVGTLQYMSPEQARGDTAFVDPRADIYSLGVTLYELITLCKPFDAETQAESLRRIELGQYEALRRVNPSVPRDLESIIEKAMAAEREDRYLSARELAEDLQRFVDGEPVLAQRPHWMHRLTRWTTRHRTATVAACIVLLFATITLTVATIAVSRDRARTVGKLEETRATLESFGLRTAEWLQTIPAAADVRHALLQDVLASQERLLDEVGDSAAVRADLAWTLQEIGGIHEQSGELEMAIKRYRRAVAIRESLARNNQGDALASLARCLNQLGLALHADGQTEQGILALERAMQVSADAMAQGVAGREAFELELATSRSNYGFLLSKTGQAANAFLPARESLLVAFESLEQLHTRQPSNLEVLQSIASTSGNLATLEATSKHATSRDRRASCAIPWSERAVGYREKAQEMDPQSVPLQQALAAEIANLASFYSQAGRTTDAIESYDRAILVQQRLVESHPHSLNYARNLALTLNNLAKALRDDGQGQRTIPTLESSLALQKDLCDRFPADVSLLSQLGGIHNNLAMELQNQNLLERADAHYRASLTCLQKAHNLTPENQACRDYLSRNLANYAKLLRQERKVFQAATVTRKRSTLWQGNPAELYSAAKDLTLVIRDMPYGSRREQWKAYAREILEQAVEAGWQGTPVEREAFEVALEPASESWNTSARLPVRDRGTTSGTPPGMKSKG